MDQSDNFFDFGFTLANEGELKELAKFRPGEEKLYEVVKMVNVLLDNLAKNPEKEYIYWPNRVEKIKEFKNKLSHVAFDKA